MPAILPDQQIQSSSESAYTTSKGSSGALYSLKKFLDEYVSANKLTYYLLVRAESAEDSQSGLLEIWKRYDSPDRRQVYEICVFRASTSLEFPFNSSSTKTELEEENGLPSPSLFSHGPTRDTHSPPISAHLHRSPLDRAPSVFKGTNSCLSVLCSDSNGLKTPITPENTDPIEVLAYLYLEMWKERPELIPVAPLAGAMPVSVYDTLYF